MKYQAEGTPLIVLAGKEYGSGSSRDWAAKGTNLLGVKAVIAESFERIHRSNLVGMGVLPLNFMPARARDPGIGPERKPLILKNLATALQKLSRSPLPGRRSVRGPPGTSSSAMARVLRIDTPKEWEYFRHGGILHYVLRHGGRSAGFQ
jgi:aconitate hydratase